MDKEKYEYLLKFIVIGNSNSGKSCLLHQFLENKFKKSSSHTIGVEFGSKFLKLGTNNVKLQIWDTAGQERFRSVARTYYRGALGAIVVYDVSNEESFQSIQQWIKDARDLARPDISIIVIGNKIDLKDQRMVDNLDAAKFCQENGVLFIETSALTGENVNDAFGILSKNILNKIENGQIDSTDIKPIILNRQGNNEAKINNRKNCFQCLQGSE